MAVSKAGVLGWFDALQRTYAENKQALTDLDAAIGDADHGINMERGFTAVQTELAKTVSNTIQSVFQTAAMVLIRTVGGASGPLYGTLFLRASAVCAGKAELDAPDVVAAFRAGVEGIQQRGKAVPGDKTMIDALVPAIEAMRQGLEAGESLSKILDAGAAAAESGMRSTIPMEARKGRASYLGPRSIGHQDPGATSSYLLLRMAADTWGAANQ
jgi:dihydroxyacetone kinase-like protein